MEEKTSTSPEISAHGLFVILAATAIALLATPLASPAMPEIAKVFAENASQEPFARMILSAISILPGDPSVIFLVKFILLSIPALFIILGAPLIGWLSDHISRKNLLVISLIVFAISGTSGYFADSFLFMFIGRAILGLAIAGVKTASVAMVGDYYQGAKREKVIGWQGSAMKIGGVIFMLLGGFLANYGWQVPFLAYLLAFAVVPSTMIALTNKLPDTGPANAVKADANLPAIPFWPACYVFVSAFLASALFFITPVQLPFFLRNAFSASPLEMGVAIAVANTVGALISLVYYRFKTSMNFVAIYAVVFAAMAIGYFIVSIAGNYAMILLGMIVAGIGFGLIVPNQSSWILSIVSPKRRGFAVGLVTTAMFLGQFAAPILVQPFINKANPSAVWTSMAIVLAILTVSYLILAMFAKKPAAKSNAAPS